MDLTKMFCEHFQQWDQTDDRNGGRFANNLNLKVIKYEWANITPSEYLQGPSRKVNVKNLTKEADVFSNVSTSKENEMVARVTLDSGILKGYNKKLRLPLPPALQSSLGESVAIDPSKETSETTDKMTIATNSGHDNVPRAATATATICCKEGHSQGYFRCTVALTGSAWVEDNEGAHVEHDIAEIIRPYCIQGITCGYQVVTWEMTGKCEFKWDFEQTITWQ